MEASSGVIRGGGYDLSEYYLCSSSRTAYGPSNEDYNVGFRVVAVPEPATMSLLAISGLVIMGYRRFLSL
jgi:cytochrome b subunit of formate dehydrogenase